jgi:hypothetical protein
MKTANPARALGNIRVAEPIRHVIFFMLQRSAAPPDQPRCQCLIPNLPTFT